MGHAYLPTDAEAEQTMGMPIANQKYWTVDDVWALPNEPGVRYEAVDGELLVTPAPSQLHQRAVLELAIRLQGFARETRVGEAYIALFPRSSFCSRMSTSFGDSREPT